MPLRTELIINTTLDDSPTLISGTHRFEGVSPKRCSLHAHVTKSGSPTSVTFTVAVSPDGGTTLVTYEKLLDLSGVDTPVANWVLTATGGELVSMSPEDVYDYLQVTATGADTNANDTFIVKVWLVYEF